MRDPFHCSAFRPRFSRTNSIGIMDSDQNQTPAVTETADPATPASGQPPQPEVSSNGSRDLAAPPAVAMAPAQPAAPQPPFPEAASINELQGRSLGSLQTYA